jgi:hypothetical protein
MKRKGGEGVWHTKGQNDSERLTHQRETWQSPDFDPTQQPHPAVDLSRSVQTPVCPQCPVTPVPLCKAICGCPAMASPRQHHINLFNLVDLRSLIAQRSQQKTFVKNVPDSPSPTNTDFHSILTRARGLHSRLSTPSCVDGLS